jgi:hypothetical protein
MSAAESEAASIPQLPDPVLTASLYHAGHLDEVIRNVVVPLRRELRRQDDPASYLWFMRYSRGGEHLKIRLHEAEPCGAEARDLLGRLAEGYLAALGHPGGQAVGAKPLPPVDPEDEAEGGYPDQSLLWTRYRRSAAFLAGKPLLSDDTYAALATRCLGRASDLALAALDEDLSPNHRQISLLEALIEGLGTLGLTADLRSSYFAFHRDCLIRALLLPRGVGAEKGAELMAQLDGWQQGLGSFSASLREVAEEEWDGADDEEDSTWGSSLSDLFGYVSQFRENPEYQLDPFSEGPGFPTIFKVFHGLANQLGLSLIDEAFAHHLLLGISRPSATVGPPVRLLDLEEETPRIPAAARAASSSANPIGAIGTAAGGGLTWPHFAARSGPEGAAWVSEYLLADRRELISATERALQLLRRHQLQEGKDLLDDVASRLERLTGDASVVLVVRRFFWSALAYYHYCLEDFTSAAEALEQAHQAIVSAIEISPFLLPLAIHCHEFRLQHARVARSRRRWREMRGHLEEVRAMLDDRAPLCALSGGRSIYFSAVSDFHRAIPSLDPEEIESLRFFFDGEHRREQMSFFFLSLYALPGVVIPYQ